MKRIKLILIFFSMLMMFSANAGAVESLVKSVVTKKSMQVSTNPSKVFMKRSVEPKDWQKMLKVF